VPLHESQVILPKDKNNKYEVHFQDSPNCEFKTQILKIGAQVSVLSPQYLRDEIIGELKASLKNQFI
jgi:predicted DNA-binding transcriptional regulator YafY